MFLALIYNFQMCRQWHGTAICTLAGALQRSGLTKVRGRLGLFLQLSLGEGQCRLIIKRHLSYRNSTVCQPLTFFSNLHDNLGKLKFYPPFQMRKSGLRAKDTCPKPHGPGMAVMCALAPGHSWAAPSLGALARTAAAVCMTPHIMPTTGTNWFDPQTPGDNIPSARSSPLVWQKPPATPSRAFPSIFCFFCSMESPGEGLPRPPYQVQQHSQGVPCALRVL